MDVLAVALAAVYGLLVGSFLNVVIHRVPAGRSVLRPPSACPGCGTGIAARDNVPVVSWLLLRGRCRTCQASISPRYPAVEALTGAAAAVVAVRFGWAPETLAFGVFAAGLIAVSAVDLDCRRIPTPILRWTLLIGGTVLAATAVVRADVWPLARAALGGIGAYGVLFAIHLASPRGMGFGDVRLAGVIGFFCGWLGPGHPALAVFCGFLLGSVVGVAVMASGRGGRRTAVPFGPFLALGATVAVLAGGPLLELYLG